MNRKFLAVFVWFPFVSAALIVNLIALSVYTNSRTTAAPLSNQPVENTGFGITALAAEEEGTGRVLGASVIGADSRALLLESFLRQHDSPMTPYADLIVQKSDEKGIDFRLVVAIAMCESNAGKRMPTSASFNAWGIAVYTGQQFGADFRDWPHAIDWVTTYIKEKYYDLGLIDLKDIGAKWAPPSVETGYSWTNCVEQFQGSIL